MFLFDILLLGPMGFRNGISSILENKHILKVSPVNTPETPFCDCVDDYEGFVFTCRSFTTAEK